jgi:hypothetical protein
MLTWLFFFFVAFGAKALLAAATIYFLIPAERSCDGCDCETLPMQMGRGGRLASALTLGTLQRRWCPRCRWEGMTRTGHLRHPFALARAEETEKAARR